MSALAPKAHDRDDVFRSPWLNAVTRAEQFHLPPPLPSLPDGIQLSDTTQSTHDLSDGEQLARYFFQRVESVSRKFSKERKGFVQIGPNITKFVLYQRSRLTRLFESLEPKARTQFSLIPYLLNANAPGVPGYQPNLSGPSGRMDH